MLVWTDDEAITFIRSANVCWCKSSIYLDESFALRREKQTHD